MHGQALLTATPPSPSASIHTRAPPPLNPSLFKTNALVKSDLDGDLAKPSSAIGMIVAALRKRKKEGTPSFTVLSCDNLPENGDKV